VWFEFNEPFHSFGNPLIATVVCVIHAATTLGCIVLFTTLHMIEAANLGQRPIVIANHGDLTQLLNRRGFYPAIEGAFENNAERAPSAISR